MKRSHLGLVLVLAAACDAQESAPDISGLDAEVMDAQERDLGTAMDLGDAGIEVSIDVGVDLGVDAGALIDLGPPDLGEAMDAGPLLCPPQCAEQVAASMVLIPAGTSTMGQPRSDRCFSGVAFPPHQVTLTYDYRIAATEVTQALYEGVMGSNPSFWSSCGPDCPVDNVSYLEAVAFLNALSISAGLTPCYDERSVFLGLDCEGYRLPTEAEWERAARGGAPWSIYNEDPSLTECPEDDAPTNQVAWYESNSGLEPHPVAQLMPNAYGLYDMLGNTWEWTEDAYSVYSAEPQIDPLVLPEDPLDPATLRMRRGGAYRDPTTIVRATNRVREPGLGRHVCVGFRIAQTAP